MGSAEISCAFPIGTSAPATSIADDVMQALMTLPKCFVIWFVFLFWNASLHSFIRLYSVLI